MPIDYSGQPEFIQKAFPIPYRNVNDGKAWAQSIFAPGDCWGVFTDGAGLLAFRYALWMTALMGKFKANENDETLKAVKEFFAVKDTHKAIFDPSWAINHCKVALAKDAESIKFGYAYFNPLRMLALLEAIPDKFELQSRQKPNDRDQMIVLGQDVLFALMPLNPSHLSKSRVYELPQPLWFINKGSLSTEERYMPGQNGLKSPEQATFHKRAGATSKQAPPLREWDMRETLLEGKKRYETALMVLDDAERLSKSGEDKAAVKAYLKLRQMFPGLPEVHVYRGKGETPTSRIMGIGTTIAQREVFVDDQYEA